MPFRLVADRRCEHNSRAVWLCRRRSISSRGELRLSRPTQSDRRRWMMILKWVIVVLVAVFVVRAVLIARRQLGQEPEFSLRNVHWSWLVLAGGLYLLALLPMGLYWHRLLRALGQRPTVWQTLRAYYIGSLGKYVPGKAMVVVLRSALLRPAQVDPAVAAVSVFAETLTMMTVGALLAAVIIVFQFASHTGLLVLAIGLMLMSGVPTWPPVFRYLVRRLHGIVARPDVEAATAGFTWRVMLQGWCANIVGWSIMGLSLWAVLRAIPVLALDPWFELWPRLTASVSLAVVAGFLSLLPSGLGVRELILNELMKEPFGTTVAAVSVILLRLIWLLAELVVSAILYIGSRGTRLDRS